MNVDALAPTPAHPPRPLDHVAAIASKEILHLVRSPRDLALLLLMPGLLTVLFGYAFEVGEVKGVPVCVVDEDGSALTQRMLRAMERDDTFRVTRAALSPAEAQAALDGDRYVVVVRFPAGLEAAARGGSAAVEVDVSGIDPDTGPSAMRALTAILVEEGLHIAATRLAVLGLDGPEIRRTLQPLRATTRVLYNPRFLFIHYVMPGIVGLVLQLVTMGLLAGTLTREKELGTLESILARPVGPLAVLAGKALPFAAISAIEVGIVLLIARLGFHVSLGRHALPALAVTGMFVIAVMSLAILISSFARTQTQSLQWTIYYTLPAFLLSGAIAPTAVMPESVRRLGMIFPLTFYCHAFRDVGLKGLPLSLTGWDLPAMALHAGLALLAARAGFRRWLA